MHGTIIFDATYFFSSLLMPIIDTLITRLYFITLCHAFRHTRQPFSIVRDSRLRRHYSFFFSRFAHWCAAAATAFPLQHFRFAAIIFDVLTILMLRWRFEMMFR